MWLEPAAPRLGGDYVAILGWTGILLVLSMIHGVEGSMRILGSIKCLLLAGCIGLVGVQGLFAQSPPRLVPATGVVLDAAGQARVGSAAVTFTIYAEQEGGEPLWSETQTLELDVAGQFSTLLGLTEPEGLPVELFSEAQARWLAIAVDSEAEGPRMFWASVPYSLKAADAETVGGLPVSAFVLTPEYRESSGTSVPPADGDGGPVGIAATAADPVPPAVTFTEDVIVQGSICAGFDCVNGEAFGFDTIRLKENNLRLHFDDTSNTSSFPANDWRIVINDSTNGGGNYFAVEDSTAGRQVFRVDAGAPSNSLYVDSGGDVGIGTSTPVLELHVADGDSPSMRLEQNGTSGFTPQTWDVAGNEANFFVRDVTNGSALPFKILPGGASNSLVVRGNGSGTGLVGIGTTMPDGTLDIERSSGNDVTLYLTETGGEQWEMKNNAATGRLTFGPAGGNVPFKFGPTAAENLLRVGVVNDNTVDVNGDFALGNTSGGTQWEFKNNSATGRLTFGQAGGAVPFKFGPTAVDNLLRAGVISSNTVEINGNLVVYGQCSEVDGDCAPDYVFEPDYELRPLADLAAFLKSNKHLPGVPSASEFSANGINMRDMNYALLEKVEELVLYTLQQQETIDELHERLRRLEAEKQ